MQAHRVWLEILPYAVAASGSLALKWRAIRYNLLRSCFGWLCGK